MGNSKYQGFMLDEPEFVLWINFNPEIVGNYSHESLSENFRWLWYQPKSCQVMYGNPFITDRIFKKSLSELDSFEFAGNKLKISASGTLDSFYRWVNPVDSDCFDTDVGPNFCRCEYEVEIPYNFTLNLVLPE
ncbi:MAG: hypothetical protein GY749_30535 [Desulfobacteraceae bacterium]|nr:hypothetical protein [Desulfobacteraceae bacterium]